MENKNVLKKKGCTTINLLTGDVDFRAYNEGGGTAQKNVVKFGEAKMYETEGEKQSSLCAHLKVDRKAADPGTELYDQLEGVLKKAGLEKKADGMAKPATKCLVNTEVLKVWHNRKTNKLMIQMVIDPTVNDSTAKLYQSLFQLTCTVNKCFVINEKSILGKR